MEKLVQKTTQASPFNPVPFFFFFGGTQEIVIVVTGRNADVQVCAVLLWGEKRGKWEILLQYLAVHWKDHSAWGVLVVGVMTEAGWFLSSSSIFRLGRHSFRCSAALGRDLWIACVFGPSEPVPAAEVTCPCTAPGCVMLQSLPKSSLRLKKTP